MKYKLKNGVEIYIDQFLKYQLDSLIYNISQDWDFVLIISGDGMVRTGKSVLAMIICAYLADKLNTPFTLEKNVHFDSQVMIDKAQNTPPHSIHLYDEAREGLATVKRFTKVQQDLVDFFNECGQLNHIFVLVLPDYFSLNWELATNRSECLINVYRKEKGVERRLKGTQEKGPVTIFQRGYFEFYNRKKKEQLYHKAKRTGIKQYGIVMPNFRGRFTNIYPLDEEGYRKLKKDALTRFAERHKEEVIKVKPSEKVACQLLQLLKERGENFSELARIYGYSTKYFHEFLRKMEEKIAKCP